MVLSEKQILCTIRQGYSPQNEQLDHNMTALLGDIKLEKSINLKKREKVISAKVNTHRHVSTDI
jgi:hypothetical protein